MHWQKKLAVAGQTEGEKDDVKYDRNRWCLNASVVLLQGIEEKKKSENELFDTKKKRREKHKPWVTNAEHCICHVDYT